MSQLNFDEGSAWKKRRLMGFSKLRSYVRSGGKVPDKQLPIQMRGPIEEAAMVNI